MYDMVGIRLIVSLNWNDWRNLVSLTRLLKNVYEASFSPYNLCNQTRNKKTLVYPVIFVLNKPVV